MRVWVQQGDTDVYSRTVRTFGSQGRERRRRREVPGNRTCPGESGSDDADLVRAAIGADDLWRVRRVHGRRGTPGSPEWSHCQGADGAGARPVLRATRHRTDRRAGCKASALVEAEEDGTWIAQDDGRMR